MRIGFNLTDEIKDFEEVFNPKKTVEDLTKDLKEIVESLNLKKDKEEESNYFYYKNFIDKLNTKDISSFAVLDKIKKEIELRKEIMPIIERITQKEVYENIISKVMSFVCEEDFYKEKALENIVF